MWEITMFVQESKGNYIFLATLQNTFKLKTINCSQQKMLTIKHSSHEKESIKICCQDFSVLLAFHVFWYLECVLAHIVRYSKSFYRLFHIPKYSKALSICITIKAKTIIAITIKTKQNNC